MKIKKKIQVKEKKDRSSFYRIANSNLYKLAQVKDKPKAIALTSQIEGFFSN